MQFCRGSSPPDNWLPFRLSSCSAGSLISGNGPCSPQHSRRSVRSTALLITPLPKVDAHVLSNFTPPSISVEKSSSEQPAPSSSGTTRLATAGASDHGGSVPRRGDTGSEIESTRPCRACSKTASVSSVKGLGCLSKGMLQQLRRLQPLVGVDSLAVVQRPAHGPWRVALLYTVQRPRLGDKSYSMAMG